MVYEESPGSTGQGCQLTAGGGNSKESATEINRQFKLVRMERQGKSLPVAWRHASYVNPTWSNVLKG